MPSDAAPNTQPTVPLTGLLETTKDYLITHANGCLSVSAVIRETLNAAAKEDAQ